MTNEEILKIAREAGFDVHPRKEEIRAHPDVSGMMIIDLTEAVKKFAALVCAANAPTWHKITDVLPEDGQYVLTRVPQLQLDGSVKTILELSMYDLCDGWYAQYGDWPSHPTHWTPLPEFKEDA